MSRPRDPSEPRTEEVLLGLGSNLGDRLEHLRAGVRSLSRFLRVSAISPVVESPPEEVDDPEEQPDYLNAVVRGRTALSPDELLAACLAAESAEGRVRTRPGAPRTLDIDVLFYGESVVDRPELRVPHPRWSERGFVLAPLLAVAAEWRDPETGRRVDEIARERGDRLERVRVAHPAESLERPAATRGARPRSPGRSG